MLDAAGTVRAANEAASRLWQTAAADLIGQPVVALFAFEVTSNDPGWRESQWEVLIATSLGRPLALDAQPFEPVPAIPIRIELETACGPDAAYFARVTKITAPSPVASASSDSTSSASVSTPATSTSAPSSFSSSSTNEGPAVLAARGPLGFFDVDVLTGRVVTSPAWKKILGYDESDVIETHAAWRELIHPDDTAALPDRVGKPSLTGARDFSVEIRLRHRLGHYVWVQSSGVQLFGADRALQRVLGVNLDITERKEAEELGFASEDRLERLADSGEVAVFDLDFTTSAYWCSSAFADLAGTDSPDSVPAALLKLLPQSATDKGLAPFLAETSPGSPFFTQAITLHTADGDKPALLAAHRQWSRKRDLVRVVGLLLPLPAGTGDGLIPGALLPGMLDTLGEAVLLTDARAQVVYLNQKASRLTGYSLAEARTQKLNDVLKLVRREDGRPDDTAVDLVLAAEEQPRLYAEHAVVSISGDTPPMPIMWTTRQVRAPGEGGPTGIIVVFRDPQEMNLTPEEIVRANRFDHNRTPHRTTRSP